MKDKQALALIRNGDSRGLAVIYKKYQSKCLAYGYKHLSEPRTSLSVGDLFHEAMIALYENAESGRLTQLTAKIDTYLIAIMRNKWLKAQRRNRAQPLTMDVAEDETEHADPIRQKVRRAVSKLDDKCREMITLKYFDHLPYDEIARLTKRKNESTVRNLISRCRKKLRELINNEPEYPYNPEEDENIDGLDGFSEED